MVLWIESENRFIFCGIIIDKLEMRTERPDYRWKNLHAFRMEVNSILITWGAAGGITSVSIQGR